MSETVSQIISETGGETDSEPGSETERERDSDTGSERCRQRTREIQVAYIILNEENTHFGDNFKIIKF